MLTRVSFQNIQGIIMCTPFISGDRRTLLVNNAFHSKFQERSKDLKVPVVQMQQHDILDTAHALNRAGHRVGLVNPSDPCAVRAGYLGMFWDNGNFRVEELLALRTTLLLGHRDVATTLWNDGTPQEQRDPSMHWTS